MDNLAFDLSFNIRTWYLKKKKLFTKEGDFIWYYLN